MLNEINCKPKKDENLKKLKSFIFYNWKNQYTEKNVGAKTKLELY